MSRRDTTFWPTVGKMGVGEMGVGEQGISPFSPPHHLFPDPRYDTHVRDV